MHVVQVSPFPGDPDGGGAPQRIHGLMTGRGSNDEVSRVVVETPDGISPDAFDPPTIKTFDDNYREVRTHNIPRAVLNALLCPFDAPVVDHVWMPWESTLLRFAGIEKLSEHLNGADIAVVEFPWQVEYVRSQVTTGTPVVYSSHNIEAEYHDPIARGWLSEFVLRQMRRVERKAVRGADMTVTVSERDQRTYRERYGPAGPVEIVPNAAYVPDLDRFAYEVPTDEALTAVFVGTAHDPNVTAVEDILQIARQTDGVEFRVIGTVCGSIDSGDVPENVALLGYVEDLAAELVASDIGLNPVTEGGGSNIKLMEYLAHGLPVLTTQFGARGVPVTDGYEVIVREIAEFPATLRAIRSDRVDLESLGKRGRQLVVSEFNWPAVSARLFDRLRELT